MVTDEEAELHASIEAAFVSMRQGLKDLGDHAPEPIRRRFIDTTMHQIKIYEKQLARRIGWIEAMTVSYLASIHVMEGEEQR